MIKFSLTKIHETSPYEIVLSGNDFRFVTDFGVHYCVSFTKEDIVLADCDTYQFIIRKIDDIRSKHDPKVELTILAIINEFFRSNQEIMLYMCDTSDGRESSRDRLFMSWFEKHSPEGRFTICKAYTTIEGQSLFISIIVANTNPKVQAIKEEFEEQSKMLTNEK